MHDTVSFVKLQALAIVFKLLAGNAEQEQNLLRLGVNKLVRIRPTVCDVILTSIS